MPRCNAMREGPILNQNYAVIASRFEGGVPSSSSCFTSQLSSALRFVPRDDGSGDTDIRLVGSSAVVADDALAESGVRERLRVKAVSDFSRATSGLASRASA